MLDKQIFMLLSLEFWLCFVYFQISIFCYSSKIYFLPKAVNLKLMLNKTSHFKLKPNQNLSNQHTHNFHPLSHFFENFQKPLMVLYIYLSQQIPYQPPKWVISIIITKYEKFIHTNPQHELQTFGYIMTKTYQTNT